MELSIHGSFCSTVADEPMSIGSEICGLDTGPPPISRLTCPLCFRDALFEDFRGIRGGNSLVAAMFIWVSESLDGSFNGSVESSRNWLSPLLPAVFAKELGPEFRELWSLLCKEGR